MAKQLSENDVVLCQALVFNPPDSQIAVMNHYYVATTPTGSGAVTTQDVATGFDNLIFSLLRALLWNTADYRGVRARTVWPIVNPMDAWVAETTNEGVGSAGAVGLPSQTCGLLRRVTEVLGKKGEGRLYLPFPSQTDNQTSGKPTTGYQSKVSDFATATVAAWAVTGPPSKQFIMVPCLFDRVAGPGPRLTSFLITADWATQRRRGAYGRANLSPI